MANGFFQGEGETRQAGGFRISRATYPVDLKMPTHGHQDAYFSFVLSGGFREQVGRTRRHIEPLSLLFHPSDEEHSVHFAPVRTQILRIEIPGPTNRRLHNLGIRLPRDAAELKGPTCQLVRRIAGEYGHRDAASEIVLEGLCLEMVGAVARLRSDAGPTARQAEDYLRNHFFEPIQVSRLAETLGVKPSSLTRAFRRQTGKSIGEYLRELRLDWAARQIADSDRAIGEIAVDAGFWDQAHFSRLFRRTWGTTPGEYRKSLAAG